MKPLAIGLLQGNFRNAFREKIPEVQAASDYRETLNAEDFEHNQQKLAALIRSAASDGADLVLSPESYLDGWSYDRDILDRVAVPVDSTVVTRLRELAAELAVWICAGLFLRDGEKIFNAAVLIDAGGSITMTYRKTHETAEVMEQMPYDLGDELPVVDTPWGKAGILICHDRWYPEAYHALRLKGAEFILNPTAGPTFWPGHSYHEIHRCCLRAHAYGSSVFLACCNSANHGGHSVIIAPDGSIVAEAGEGEEVLVSRLDSDDYSSYDFMSRRRPTLYPQGEG